MNGLDVRIGRLADAVEQLADALERSLHKEPEPLTWTLEEAAEQLGQGPRFVAELAARGEIPALKIGRKWVFSRTALRNYVEGVAS